MTCRVAEHDRYSVKIIERRKSAGKVQFVRCKYNGFVSLSEGTQRDWAAGS